MISPYGGKAKRRGPDDMDDYADDLFGQSMHYLSQPRSSSTLILGDLYVALEQLARECAYLRRRVTALEGEKK
jgi:hypothetical protein